jgi:hypothetical protein
VSILNRLNGRRHLDDSAMAALWSFRVAAGTSERPLDDGPLKGDASIEPGPGAVNAAAAHIQACTQCRARYGAFTEWLADARVEAIGEADHLFPAERLATQQARIVRRLETLERPARVIAFPGFAQPAAVVRHAPQRWIAAGLAAGLIVGLGAGELLDFRRSFQNASAGQAVSSISHNARGALQPITLSSDDAFLSDDSEAASTSPSVEALQALDALTPRVRDLDQAR